jgi:uncharacterized protein (DUF3084 family)
VGQRESLLTERDGLVGQRESLLTERDGLVGQRESLLAERDGLVGQRESLLAERDAWLAQRETFLTERDAKLVEMEIRINDLQVLIQNIQNGVVFRLLGKYRQVLDRVSPVGTRRRYLYDLSIRRIGGFIFRKSNNTIAENQ